MTLRPDFCSSYAQTDTGNAEFFAWFINGRTLFDHKQGRWLIWNTKLSRWEEDRTGQIIELAKAAVAEREKQARALPETTAELEVELKQAVDESILATLKLRKMQFINHKKAAIKWVKGSESLFRINALLTLARSLPAIADPGTDWDQNHMLLGVENGVVELRTGRWRARTKQDRITKTTGIAHDPKADCPRWKQFLQEIFGGDEELIGYIQRAVGYTLTGSTREQCLFACYGSGSNGKTTLFEILIYLLGDYATDLPFASLDTKRHSIGEGVNLPGSRFVKSVETSKGRQLDEARIKSWTGGDTITIRPLHRNAFSFAPTHKHWMAFNDKPVIRDDSPAMWRRIRLIPFTQTFNGKGKDESLSDKLKAEASGILNWAIAGCVAWQQDGLGIPKAVELATAQYQAESDPIGPFLEDCCVVGSDYFVSKGELQVAYSRWCRDNLEKPLTRQALADRLRKSFTEGRKKTQRFWVGIGLVVHLVLGAGVVSPEADDSDAKSLASNMN